jgi:hypothetical protein
MTVTLLRALVLFIVCSCAATTSAQGFERQIVAEEPASDESSSWYAETTPTTPTTQPTPRMIIQQKAQMRAHQRIARIESMKWYGFSAARPMANATPFSGVPAPRYEMPGGRPFSWHPYRGTSVVIVR